MRTGAPLPNCTMHPRVRAGWHCTVCDKRLCVNCAGYRQVQSTQLLTCVHCHERAEPIRITRAEAHSFAAQLPRAALFPFTAAGLLAMFAASLVFFASNFLGCFGTLLAQAILWSYVFHLARRSALGSDTIEPPDFSGLGDLFLPFFRGSFAVVMSWLPALLFVALMPAGPPVANPRAGLPVLQQVRPHEPAPNAEATLPTRDRPERVNDGRSITRLGAGALIGQHPAIADGGVVGREPSTHVQPGWSRALAHPALWALLLLGFILGPMSLAIAVAGGGFLDMMNPVRLVGCALKFPKSYALFAATLLGLGVAQLLVSIAAGLLTLMPVPFVGELLGGMMLCVVPLMAGRTIGLYLYVHGAALGYLQEQEQWVNVLGTIEPVGVLRDVGVPRPRPMSAREPDEEGPMAGLSHVSTSWAPPARPEIRYADEVAADGSAPSSSYVRPREIELPEDTSPDAVHESAAPAHDGGSSNDDAPAHDAGRSQDERRREEVAGAHRDGPAEDDEAAAAEEEAEIALLGVAPDRERAESSGPPARSPEDAIREAVAQRDFARALQFHRMLDDGARALLTADAQFEVGRQAAGEGDLEYAVNVLHAAAQIDPNDPIAPRALIVMARIIGERMADAAGAERVYRFVAKTYPGTDAAKFAQQRLAATS